ncbi:hypothetical protein K469DRAFT_609363 [Zopfia rhizophila CBS 207.26]|uniref:HypA-like protein n=1 Tax=Zopfia rhizophila CBS 207.26 TaxID=1314779 RepID=A0A6A6DBW7_9PEZI|nr:hypothetical protein K469DRAFT_609363 [Zopfia rhizophila CBS 207.26]
MATASIVNVSQSTAGVYHVPSIPNETLETATRVLQANHEQHHVFFNDRGFHNHITHYLLTQTAIAATPAQIERAYVQEKALQRPQFPIDQQAVEQMKDEDFFRSCVSQGKHYQNFLTFFERKIAEHGVGPVVYEHLFSHKPNAELLFSRMFASFLHPLIHFGFGVEFDQPPIIAEGLAQAAVHQPEVAHFFKSTEAAMNATVDKDGRPMIDLIREVEQNDKIRNAPCLGDGSFIADDPLLKAPEDLWHIAAKWHVSPDQLEEKTAEMINVNAYFTAAAQMAPKEHKLDFFLIHNVNCSIFFSAFLQKDWLRVEDKVRLLEWKGRFDIVSYAARGSPRLRIEDVINYRPKKPTMGWDQLFKRVNAFLDDSHVCKLIRALANGAQVCKPYELHPKFPMKNSMFLQTAHMAMDSTEDALYLMRWVRGAGFKQQWEKFKDRAPEAAASAT